MKRDMNIIRDLLLFYESDCTASYPTADDETIGQHLFMLVDAGLIDGNLSGMEYEVFHVTWQGHEFLAAAGDQNIWNKEVRAVGSMTFEIIKEYLEQLLRNSIGHDP